MSKTPGYIATLKLFIPAPKTDFKAQAAAATVVGALAETKKLTPELIALAKVIDVSAKFGSAEVEETAPKGETDGGGGSGGNETVAAIGGGKKKAA